MNESSRFTELSAERKQQLARQAVSEWRRDVRKCRSAEDLVGVADGTLKTASFGRWLRVRGHLLHCALCRAEVTRVRQAVEEPYEWGRRGLLLAACGLVVVILGGVGLQSWHDAQLRLAAQEAIAKAQQEAQLRLVEQEARATAQQEAAAKAQHDAQLRLAVQEAIIDSLSDLAQLRTQMASAPAADVSAAVRQIQAVPLRAVVQGQTYSAPYLFVGEGPKHPEVLAEGLLRSKDLQAEYEAFLRQWATLLADLGDRLVQEGKVEDALMVFTYLGQKNPEAKDVLFALGTLLKMTGQHEQAVAVYNDMIDRGLAADDPRPWHFAGWSYYQLGDCQTALRYYDKALSIFPRYAKVHYNIARCYLSIPGLQAAERARFSQEHLQRALDLTLAADQREGDDNPRIPFTLAILYAEMGQWDQALEKLERAVQKERTYRIHAQADPAFAAVRDDPSAPYHERFNKLLKQYQPPALGGFGARLEATFDPEHFSE